MQARWPSLRQTRWIAVAGAAASVLTVVVFAIAFWDQPSAVMWTAPSIGAFAGGVVALRTRPDLVAARRLVAFGATSTAWIGATVALVTAFEDVGRRWWLGPGDVAVQVLGLAMWAAMISLLAVYPDGTYRRRHQILVVRALSALAVAVPVGLLIAHPTVHPSWAFGWGAESSALRFPDISSPLHVGFLSFLSPPLRVYLDAALTVSPVVGALVGGLRYRSLPPGERLAMRWPLYGVVAVLVAPLAGWLHALGGLSTSTSQALQVVGLLALPASLAVGLVRPDLFEVDRVMRRSVVYAALWTAIVAAYVGGAAALGMAAPGEGVQLAIAATIGASLLFEPARRHLAGRAARWAKGEAISGEELVRRLGSALEHTLDLEQLIATVAAVAREGMGVRWVRVTVAGVAPALSGDEVIAGQPPSAAAPLVRGGEELGQIECGPPLRGARGAGVNADLLTALAGQVALAVHNARLAAEVRRRLAEVQETTAELAASRSRLVAAHETARRQIERDIHDGAQQELVALIAGLGLARQIGGGGGPLDETLAGLQADAGHAFDNLRRLAAGIHPAVLSDHGLVEAIEIRSARLPLSVLVRCEPDLRRERFGEVVEGAAYFFVSEALANALKHAGASEAVVSVGRTDCSLEVVVADDGAGFDVAAVRQTGLRGITDRIEAIGGTVHIASSPGSGTRLTMRLPIDDREPV